MSQLIWLVFSGKVAKVTNYRGCFSRYIASKIRNCSSLLTIKILSFLNILLKKYPTTIMKERQSRNPARLDCFERSKRKLTIKLTTTPKITLTNSISFWIVESCPRIMLFLQSVMAVLKSSRLTSLDSLFFIN